MSEKFKLIVITTEKAGKDESDLINELFEAGLQSLHLRKPNYSIEETKTLLNAISSDFHPKIVIHKHYELLNVFNLKGAHLSEIARKEGKTNAIRNIISSSFHRLDSILTTAYKFEYAFFSPVFQSISKRGYRPSVKPEILTDFFISKKSQLKFPVIALGGITDTNILQTQNMGFSGAACIGYIWENNSPVVQFNTLQKLLQG
jgi:thiamine-phosphate pyrophosphorylase